jgi:hypothetical protein
MNATAPLTHFIPQHWPRAAFAADMRVRIAKSIERVIEDAAGPAPSLSPRVPLARGAVNACASRLRAIAGRLRSDRAVPARVVVQAAMLIREGSSPLYAVGSSEELLRHCLAEVAARDGFTAPSLARNLSSWEGEPVAVDRRTEI